MSPPPEGQLNKVRNLGELFRRPSVLKPLKYTISASLELEKNCSCSEVIDLINVAFRQFTFPFLQQKGYKQLIEEGVQTDKLFDGPKLDNGWIYEDDIVSRKRHIKALDAVNLIAGVKGVKSVSGLTFLSVAKDVEPNGTIEPTLVSALEVALPVLDLSEKMVSENITLIQNGEKISYRTKNGALYQSNLQELNALDHISASTQLIPKDPKGTFLDVSDYYSIQETFPAIFKVGPNSPNEKAPSYQQAQSNQLKGYLMAFDQTIANQFAQLANISRLFSFRNLTYGDPESREVYEREY